MLTHKQLWRRQKVVSRFHNHDVDYAEANYLSRGPSPASSAASFDSLHSLSMSSGSGDHDDGTLLHSSTGISTPISHQKKKVRFVATVNQQPIPHRDDYYEIGLDDDLWWNRDDYNRFKESAIIDLRSVMEIDNRIDCKSAKMILFQPHDQLNSAARESLQYLAHKLKGGCPKS